jgi:hypothetical protein
VLEVRVEIHDRVAVTQREDRCDDGRIGVLRIGAEDEYTLGALYVHTIEILGVHGVAAAVVEEIEELIGGVGRALGRTKHCGAECAAVLAVDLGELPQQEVAVLAEPEDHRVMSQPDWPRS